MLVLEKIDTEFGKIKITRSKSDGTCTYYQDDCFHSQAHSDGVSTCVYVHVLHEIIRQSKAHRILMIGCAGGTLATMLDRIGCKITVVDINPHAFRIAKSYFQMPGHIKCVLQDGVTYLEKTRKRFDAIVIDAFNPDNSVPDAFTTAPFFRTVKKVLTSSGIMVMNVMTKNDKDLRADTIGLNIEAAKMSATLFDWPRKRDRNTLIAAKITDKIQIPSNHEPKWIKRDLKGIIRRSPVRKNT